MWAGFAHPTMPVYNVKKPAKRKGRATTQSSESADSLSQTTTNDTEMSSAPSDFDSNLTDLLEPAVDGPPSPERIRALSKQMQKNAGLMDKHQSHQTTSSGSSSLRSLASADRPSWEQALESITLSRRSSNRSTSSSMPSRDRPESVQVFGKTIFNRRTKLKRESSAQSSSGSSMYSTDMPQDAAPGPSPASVSRESSIPSLFSRRRTMRSDSSAEEPTGRGRLQISGPYNFQHVTHTQRDELPNLQRGNRVTLQSELQALRASKSPRKGSLKGNQQDDFHFANFSSEALPLDGKDADAVVPQLTSPSRRQSGISPTSPNAHRRLINRTRSQEQMRIPPPRPPRSPIEAGFSPPVPPPRMSSRLSGLYDGFSSLGGGRPQTSGGFRRPQPLPLAEEAASPPATSYGIAEEPEINSSRFSRLFAPPPDDSNWPLTCPINHNFEAALPDVPEEEEHVALGRRSRASVRSTNSSLRGSQSVPLLRQMAQNQPATRRPPSGESVTLGRMDLFSSQMALKEGVVQESIETEALPRDSWEEVIDYCYDHEAEADCDYAWDRPSLDLIREENSTTPVEVDIMMKHRHRRSQMSQGRLTPGRFDMPALSPASQFSTATIHEAMTPTAPAIPPRANFSIPRKDLGQQKQRFLHIRTASQASSFKESQGFDLSPSLLIPSDYHHELLAHQADKLVEAVGMPQGIAYDEPTLTMDTSTLLVQSRSSASTTGSNDSAQTSSDRHVSTASTATDYTRLTASTASIQMDDDFMAKQEAGSPDDHEDARSSKVRFSNTGVDVVVSGPDDNLTRPLRHHMGHGSETNLLKKGSEDMSAGRWKDSILTRRGRSRTTSLSTPPPPGQYALFPSVNMTGARI